MLGVAFGERDVNAGELRVLARDLEQRGREVKALTCAPARAAVIAATPVPVPTSSTVSPGAMPAKRTRCAETGVVNVAVGANDAHISRCRALNAENGSSVMRISVLTLANRSYARPGLWVKEQGKASEYPHGGVPQFKLK